MEEKVSDEDFSIVQVLGSGSFSNVYEAVNKNNHHFALKKLFWNNSPSRILKEIRILTKVQHPNIIKLLYVYRDGDQATLVMDFVQHLNFRELIQKPKGSIIQQYMYGLLSALECLHSNGIIHRDIKPANYLFNPETGQGCLIDFGLSEEYRPLRIPKTNILGEDQDEINDEDNSILDHPEIFQRLPRMLANRAGTRGFRAPEVLMSYSDQTPKIDIWSAGIILLSFLSQRYPFFKSPDDLTSLYEISLIVGTQSLKDAAHEISRKLRFPEEHEKPESLYNLIQKLNPFLDEIEVYDSVYDLLEKMLNPKVSERLTAQEALQHPFFHDL